MKFTFPFALLCLVCMGKTAGAASSMFFELENYRSRQDNPFFGNPSLGTIYLDDFEPPNSNIDPYNTLITPYATGWNGAISASPFRGVKEDSKASDPDGGFGYRWTITGIVGDTRKDPPGIHFDFTPDSNGRLPEYIGAALLGKFDLQNVGGRYNRIFVYDRNGNEITGGAWQLPKPMLSDPIPEDPSDYFSHFAGIYYSEGISRIQFRDFVEVDHLTYGYSIPEPSAALLVTAAGLLCLRRKRRIIP